MKTPIRPITCIIVIIVLMVIITTDSSLAQSSFRKKQYYYGFEGSFGVKAFRLTSNIEKIDQMRVTQEGGSLAFVAGNDQVRARLQGAGFYYSSTTVRQTVNMVESAAFINVYPLQFFQPTADRIFNLYVTGGVSYSRMKFFGFYLHDETQVPVNYSVSEAPFLGRNLVTSAVYGGGIEIKVPHNECLNIFTEVLIAAPLARQADAAFASTTLSRITTVAIGVSFGSLFY